MPFKTKKRKLKAKSRRFVFGEGTVSIVDHGETINLSVPIKTISRKMEIRELVPRELGIENVSYIRKDLVKIILLSLGIAGAQLVLRLTLIK